MGWWKIKDVESGQIAVDLSKEERDNLPDLVIGDGPADIMGDAIDKIIACYVALPENDGRKLPCRQELQACFNFVVNPIYNKDNKLVNVNKSTILKFAMQYRTSKITTKEIQEYLDKNINIKKSAFRRIKWRLK